MADIDEFRRFKVDQLRKYCQERGLSVSSYRRKDELVALAFAVCCQQLPIVGNKDDNKSDAVREYGELLMLSDGCDLPDPWKLDGWITEKDGVKFWPPCMIINISDYLIAKGERPLYTRLTNDYKEGMKFVLSSF